MVWYTIGAIKNSKLTIPPLPVAGQWQGALGTGGRRLSLKNSGVFGIKVLISIL